MESLLDTLRSIHPAWGYTLLFLSSYLENIISPLPGDTVTIFGAYLVGIGMMRFTWVFVATTLGSVLGFMTLFGVGRLVGKRLQQRRTGWFSDSRHWARVERWFGRYGYRVVAVNRFLSGARSVISLVAGALQLDTVRVLVLATVSALVWNGLLIWVGMAVGEHWETVIDQVRRYNLIVGGVVVLLLAYGIYRSRIWRWE